MDRSVDPGTIRGWVIGAWENRTVIGKPIVWPFEVKPLANFGEVTGEAQRNTSTKRLADAAPQIGDTVDLEPVYDVTLGVQMTPQGPVIIRIAFPLMSFSSVKSVRGVKVQLLCDELSRQERQDLANAIEGASQFASAVRAEEAGIRPPSPADMLKLAKRQ